MGVGLPLIVSFMGKGGVGKTTCSAAAAISYSRRGYRTMLVTSDPTPSLSDILGLRIGNEPKRVVENLWAVELDSESIIKMWKSRFGEEVYRVVSSLLPVDREIIDYVAGAPGIDFQFMLAYLLDAYRSGRFDIIVWDTAPAGGTLNLLEVEQKLYTHLGEAFKLYLSLRSTFEKIRRRKGDDPLKLIDRWRKLAIDVLNMLSSESFKCIVVSIPEFLGVKQTERIIAELKKFNIKVVKVFVNQIASGEDCECEAWRSQVRIHKKYLAQLKELYMRDPGIVEIPLQRNEIKGVGSLSEFSRIFERELPNPEA